MTTVRLEPTDLVFLKQLTPDLQFDDDERIAALLESDSRDFNAVPGSGKTSLLAAKLLLLARKWPHVRKGICVLSHTNVAREEITRRLASSAHGAELLRYPHFLGTIHAFFNHFVGLHALHLQGIRIDVIDDDVFARRALAKLGGSRFFKLRKWLERKNHAERLVSTLHFSGNDLAIVSEVGELPSEGSDSGRLIREIKTELTRDGVLRHRDMLALADVVLERCPSLADAVSCRFPMLFVDEMQDTSSEQERLLSRIFDGRAVVQRFGDTDQKLLSDDDANEITFPRTGYGTISTSLRFGPKIADAISRVRLSQLPVIGAGAHDLHPVLLLYRSEHVAEVIPQFGRMVVERLGVDPLAGQRVRAMCARKMVDGNVEPGRHLGEYWPPFAEAQHAHSVGKDGFWSLMQAKPVRKSPTSIFDRTNSIRKALFSVLVAAEAPILRDVRDSRALLRSVSEQGGDVLSLQKLFLDLTLSPEPYDTQESRGAFLASLYERLAYLLPENLALREFSRLETFQPPTVVPVVGKSSTACEIAVNGRSLSILVGTVAGMKGETHFASLVLESYGGRSRKFDLEVALRCIAGIGNKLNKLTPTQRAQMRSVYVAMSRPTHLLCLAANQSRVNAETRSALESMGWNIESVF